MRSIAVIGLILATALAGCTAPQPASENLSISISDVGKSPYVLGIPLWLSDDGANATTWLSPDHAAVHSGNVTEFRLQETEQGTALWIAGNGTVTIGFADVKTITGAAFTEGAFTLGTGPGGTRPMMFVQEGDVDVQWFYEGISEACYSTGSFTWQADSPGWHEAQLGGRMSHDCIA